jgi:hypothetical protein
MRRIMTIVAGMALAVSLSLMVTLLDLRPAEAQGDIITSLLSAGTYVEDPATVPGSPRIVVIYADGNWTLFNPATTSLMFGTWEERVGGPTDTDTATATDTATDTSSVTLDGVLVDQAGISLPYTLQLGEMFTSVTVTNTTTQVTFDAVRIAIGTDTDTDTDTDTATDTDTDIATDTATATQ